MNNETPRRKPNELKKKKDVEGEGFVMKGEPYAGKTTGKETWLEMRQGETTEKAQKRQEINEKERRAKEAKITPKERARLNRKDTAEAFEIMLKQREGKYSETLLINPDRSIDRSKRKDGVVPFITSMGDLKNSDDLYQLLHKISQEHPELNISIETDPKWKWIKYEVSKKPEK